MSAQAKHRVIFISGLSGAGKSVVLHALEDLDYYCIDNFPIKLISSFFAHLNEYPAQIAIGINAHNQEAMMPELLNLIRDSENNLAMGIELIFLEADNDILMKRYSETRRKHPFSNNNSPLQDAISNERSLLTSLAESADLKIDTTRLNVHDLRDLVNRRIAGRDTSNLSIQLISFGFKYSAPHDADFIFDVRCLPNPYWESSLRGFSGKDKEVIEYLDSQPLAHKMADQLSSFISEWLEYFDAENRSYLTIGIGCTGGRHRSVYIVDKLAAVLSDGHDQLIINHRDL